jgi:hypothetical protein
MNGWPDALRLRTRKFLDGIDPFPGGEILYMKNTNGFFAYIKKEDLLNGEIIFYDKETKLKTQFYSAGELFDAGWVVDMRKNGDLRLQKLEESKPGKQNRLIKFEKL